MNCILRAAPLIQLPESRGKIGKQPHLPLVSNVRGEGGGGCEAVACRLFRSPDEHCDCA